MKMVLQNASETEVYVSDYGYLVLKQVDMCGEESFVSLSPEQSAAVSDFMLKNIENQKRLWLLCGVKEGGEAE